MSILGKISEGHEEYKKDARYLALITIIDSVDQLDDKLDILTIVGLGGDEDLFCISEIVRDDLCE